MDSLHYKIGSIKFVFYTFCSHLTNTPDLDKSHGRSGESQPFTPEVTLRRCASATFNIFATHVDDNQPLDHPIKFGSKRTKSAYIEQVIPPVTQAERPVTSLSQKSNNEEVKSSYDALFQDGLEDKLKSGHSSRHGSGKSGMPSKQAAQENIEDFTVGIDSLTGTLQNAEDMSSQSSVKPQILTPAMETGGNPAKAEATLPKLSSNEGKETPAPLSRPVSADSQSTRGMTCYMI